MAVSISIRDIHRAIGRCYALLHPDFGGPVLSGENAEHALHARGGSLEQRVNVLLDGGADLAESFRDGFLGC